MSVEAFHNTKLDSTSALEVAKKYDFDAMFIMGMNSKTGAITLLCGGDNLNYGLLYWLAVEAQNQIHDSVLSED